MLRTKNIEQVTRNSQCLRICKRSSQCRHTLSSVNQTIATNLENFVPPVRDKIAAGVANHWLRESLSTESVVREPRLVCGVLFIHIVIVACAYINDIVESGTDANVRADCVLIIQDFLSTQFQVNSPITSILSTYFISHRGKENADFSSGSCFSGFDLLRPGTIGPMSALKSAFLLSSSLFDDRLKKLISRRLFRITLLLKSTAFLNIFWFLTFLRLKSLIIIERAPNWGQLTPPLTPELIEKLHSRLETISWT